MSSLVLDELFADVSIAPQAISLLGKSYTVRRDLTPNELVDYYGYVAKEADDEALKILVGNVDGPKLNKQLRSLPHQHMKVAMRKIMEVAGILAETESGE